MTARPQQSADQALVAEVRDSLRAAGDPARAPTMQAYMKSEMPFHGVPAPLVRRVVRTAVDAHPIADRPTWAGTVRELWDGASHREERYAALGLAGHRRYRAYLEPQVLPLLEHLVRTGAWWDLVDDIATHLVGALLLGHHDAATPVVLEWSLDGDRWLRRTAVICQLGAKERTDLELLTSAVDATIDDRDFLVRKAIGWALRQYAYTDPDWVRTFVAVRADRLSGLSRREAIKHLGHGVSAAERWAAELASWEIDPAILAAAPESPWGFPAELFPVQDDVESPLADLARAALPPGGSVLDVGAGAGAASLRLAGAVGRLHAVDSQPSMLRALEESAGDRGVPVTTYDGPWPDVADQVPVCDVVVCAHVLYNIHDVVPFVAALTSHARSLVVVELTATHPLVRLGPLWQAVHDQLRPSGPTAELAVEVLREAGIEPRVTTVIREPQVRTGALQEAWVDFTRRQLCLPVDRRPEVEELMRRHPSVPRPIIVLSWAGTGT